MAVCEKLEYTNTISNRKHEKVNTIVQLEKRMFGTIRMKGTGLSFFKIINNKNIAKIMERKMKTATINGERK